MLSMLTMFTILAKLAMWLALYVLYAKTTSKIFSEAEKFNFLVSTLKKNLVTMNFEGFHF